MTSVPEAHAEYFLCLFFSFPFFFLNEQEAEAPTLASLSFFFLVDERKRGEHGLTKNLRPARQVLGARGCFRAEAGAGPRAGPGARGGLGAARSAGPSPPLA